MTIGKKMRDSQPSLGDTVIILSGGSSGRIVNYDDEDEDGGAICYVGTLMMYSQRIIEDIDNIRMVTTDDLMNRFDELQKELSAFNKKKSSKDKQLDLFHEFHYITSVLMERWNDAQFKVDEPFGKYVFISYSSKDKQIARWLSVDLSKLGHRTWLDEWEIKVGESIPKKISKGLDDCDCVIVLLSSNSVKSGWVEREWESRYWDEVEVGDIKVLPILVEPCKIPRLLKTKMYANFTEDYSEGLEELARALMPITD